MQARREPEEERLEPESVTAFRAFKQYMETNPRFWETADPAVVLDLIEDMMEPEIL